MDGAQIVVELRLMERGKLKAFADVTIPSALGELTLRGFRVVQTDAHGMWVAFPSTSYQKDGQMVNKPVVEASPSMKRRITEAVLAEFERLVHGPNGFQASSRGSDAWKGADGTMEPAGWGCLSHPAGAPEKRPPQD